MVLLSPLVIGCCDSMTSSSASSSEVDGRHRRIMSWILTVSSDFFLEVEGLYPASKEGLLLAWFLK